jgi:hypothetical protein
MKDHFFGHFYEKVPGKYPIELKPQEANGKTGLPKRWVTILILRRFGGSYTEADAKHRMIAIKPSRLVPPSQTRKD